MLNFQKHTVSYQIDEMIMQKRVEGRPEKKVACQSCKHYRQNHFVGETQLRRPNITDDPIMTQMKNINPREFIEQLIIDPKQGVIKREIHFAIIDYMSVSINNVLTRIDICNAKEIGETDQRSIKWRDHISSVEAKRISREIHQDHAEDIPMINSFYQKVN